MFQDRNVYIWPGEVVFMWWLNGRWYEFFYSAGFWKNWMSPHCPRPSTNVSDTKTRPRHWISGLEYYNTARCTALYCTVDTGHINKLNLQFMFVFKSIQPLICALSLIYLISVSITTSMKTVCGALSAQTRLSMSPYATGLLTSITSTRSSPLNAPKTMSSPGWTAIIPTAMRTEGEKTSPFTTSYVTSYVQIVVVYFFSNTLSGWFSLLGVPYEQHLHFWDYSIGSIKYSWSIWKKTNIWIQVWHNPDCDQCVILYMYDFNPRWKFYCCRAISYCNLKCQWTPYINNFDEDISWHVPSQNYLVGAGSYHSNPHEWVQCVCDFGGGEEVSTTRMFTSKCIVYFQRSSLEIPVLHTEGILLILRLIIPFLN